MASPIQQPMEPMLPLSSGNLFHKGHKVSFSESSSSSRSSSISSYHSAAEYNGEDSEAIALANSSSSLCSPEDTLRIFEHNQEAPNISVPHEPAITEPASIGGPASSISSPSSERISEPPQEVNPEEVNIEPDTKFLASSALGGLGLGITLALGLSGFMILSNPIGWAIGGSLLLIGLAGSLYHGGLKEFAKSLQIGVRAFFIGAFATQSIIALAAAALVIQIMAGVGGGIIVVGSAILASKAKKQLEEDAARKKIEAELNAGNVQRNLDNGQMIL